MDAQSSNKDNQAEHLHGSENQQGENIRVAVRLRPFTTREEARGCERIIEIEQNTVLIQNPRNNFQQDSSINQSRRFTFDYAYWSHDGFKKNDLRINVADLNHPNGYKYVDQEKVFNDLGTFLINNALEGYNSALLAYGQTGSGKSYSVSGYGQNIGILPRFAAGLFESLNNSIRDSLISYQVYFSMIEIYNEIVRDLLATHLSELLNPNQHSSSSSMISRGLKVREHPKHGFFVENLSTHLCSDKADIEQKIEEGQMNKSIVATNMNETSSRGHTIYEFTIKLTKKISNNNNNDSSEAKANTEAGGAQETISSVVQIVDLAGSERVTVQMDNISESKSTRSPLTTADHTNKSRQRTKPSATSSASVGGKVNRTTANIMALSKSQRFKESISINQSLSTLGNCIQVLSQYSQQLETIGSLTNKKVSKLKIPYRDSVLTKLLNKCCLSGNSKVVIMATLSPADVHYDDTLSTLRFADRAKQIKTHATINQITTLHSKTNGVLEALTQENNRLKRIVEDGHQSINKSDDSSQTSNFDENENIAENFSGSRFDSRINRSSKTVSSKLKSKSSIKQHSKKVTDGSKLTAEQLSQLVSPAREKLKKVGATENELEDKVNHHKYQANISKDRPSNIWHENDGENDEDLDIFDETIEDESQLSNSKTLTSPESDDSFGMLEADDVSEKEKIEILNKLLSNSRIVDKLNSEKRSQTNRKFKRTNDDRGGLAPKKFSRKTDARRLSIITGDLKNSNPYLSNLNQDEQLTGKISYIVKDGFTIIGRDENCDIVLHGPEIRMRHAKIVRLTNQSTNKKKLDDNNIIESTITIEPIFDADKKATSAKNQEKNSALMVNGIQIIGKTKLNHCDRVLIGTNSYFVFMDNASQLHTNNSTMANLDMVTFDMAREEVARNLLEQDKNKEQVINEINNYQHRPGTGKYKANGKANDKINDTQQISSKINQANINEADLNSIDSTTSVKMNEEQDAVSTAGEIDTIYKDQLMVDTYELTLPVTEANAIARELGIKVNYSMKILTSDERLINESSISDYATDIDSNTSEPTSAANNTNEQQLLENDNSSNENQKQQQQEKASNNITYPKSLSSLDNPPEVYVKVESEDFNYSFYWTNDKFRARHAKMFELFGVWDNDGKTGLIEYLIEQTRISGKYIIDPFIDDPLQTYVLIGHSQIVLQPISHFTDIQHSFDILDLDDVFIGNIKIQATPCKEIINKPRKYSQKSSIYYEPYSESELKEVFLDDPQKLLGKKLAFELKVISCCGLPQKYCNIYCQYSLDRELPFVKTKSIRINIQNSKQHSDDRQSDSASTIYSSSSSSSKNNQSKPQSTYVQESSDEEFFNNTQYIVFDSVSQDTLDFLQHGFLAIQVVGQYYHPTNKPLTVISTIIRSIEKFMNNMQYQQQRQQQDTEGYNSEYSNNTDLNAITPRADNAIMNKSSQLPTSSGGSSITSASNLNRRGLEEEEGVDNDEVDDDDDSMEILENTPQEGVIDMILTKRKLDRAENQLHYLRRTINLAEQNNKKNIPIRTMKRLLGTYGHTVEGASFDEVASDVSTKDTNNHKTNGCSLI